MKTKTAPKTRTRRTEDQRIEELQAKIARLEERKTQRSVKADPTLRLASKLVKTLRKAEAEFLRMNRVDLANSVKAAAISLSGTAGAR
jgi:uncharacterized protein YqeY